MFNSLTASKGDTLLSLIAAFRADPRPSKIDVGVGVYRDAQGCTPVMAAVKEAESRLLASQDSKTYLGPVGSADFNAAIVDLVLQGDADVLRKRVRAVQTPGGTAALRALLDLAALCRPDAAVWISTPSWINHVPLVEAARLKARDYPYFDAASGGVKFDDMMATLAKTGPGDVVLLHGCCHNPSGADLDETQWNAVADLAAERGFLPLIDLAYQGLGRGIEADSCAVRCMAARVDELLVATSCSKNFALYRDRVGCAMVFSTDTGALTIAFDRMLGLIRGNYSMPPDHGAAVVAAILGDARLSANWTAELQSMRERLQGLRQALSDRFRERTGNDGFDFIARQFGMFSMLGLSATQVLRLREEHAIYMPGDSRTNIAGLRSSEVDTFVDAVLAVRSSN